MPSHHTRISWKSLARLIALLLASQMMLISVPPAVVAATAREALIRTGQASHRTWLAFTHWIKAKPAAPQPAGHGVKPLPPETKAQKEARLARLEINPSGDVRLQSQQPMWFIAVPFDRDGSAIHGLQAEWQSSDKQVVFIKKSGQAIAGKPGSAILTARVGALSATVRVNVTRGNGERFGGKKPFDSVRVNRRASQQRRSSKESDLIARNTRRHHAAGSSIGFPIVPAMPMRDPNDDPLPDSETSSLYQAVNAIGSPPGKQKAGAPTEAAAIRTVENGNKNFSFVLPIAGMPGRGLNASVSLVYNSNVWNKSTDGYTAYMTYDVDSSWPAAGWRITLGQIENQGSYGFTLTDMDGTRHALTYTSSYNYDTTDGSFIHYYGGASWGYLYYPDGSIASYGAGGNGYRLYPTAITDRNGNYIVISYVNNVGPKISSIIDTLGRYINFYYASNGDLVTVTQPGIECTGCPSDVQTIRFYYDDVSIGSSLFDSTISVSGPGSVHTIKSIYLPTSSESTNSAYTGYQFDYSVYGMVRQITEYRGMTVSTDSATTTGSVTSNGNMAAQTTYDYPTSGQSFTDVPTYSTRTDDWAGRTTSSAPQYSFSVNESTGIATVTAPDNVDGYPTVTETHSIVNPGQWDDGLVSDTYIKGNGTTYARTHFEWEGDSNYLNPRIYQVVTTEGGLSKATVLSYTNYNNVSVVSERDFGGNETTPSSTELRKTETTYITSSSYINRHLLHLPATVKVVPGGSSTPASRVDYTYDDYGTSHANMTSRDDIVMHDPAYDPFQQTQESCDWVCREWDQWWVNCIDWQWECTYYNPYDAATDYRGNVTSVTTYADAATPSDSITRSITYDIAGNVTSAEVDCCQKKIFSYTDSPNTHTYAYPTSVTSGNPNGINTTTSATYSFNTGLLSTSTDENSQATTNNYSPNSLRLTEVDYPGGGVTSFVYSDGLAADGSGRYHSYVKTSIKLDANGSGGSTRYVDSYKYLDGRGAVARAVNSAAGDGWAIQDVEYDSMGRAYRASNPYYSSSGYSAAVNSDGFWTTSTFDHLGRVTQVTMPRGDDNNTYTTNVSTIYDGQYTTVTDQAGKHRRQKVDALGRVIRLDEPTTTGNPETALGSLSSPNQPTNYYYDVLDNLVRIEQGSSQSRYFKYDSLSRLIRERQVEQSVNSNYDLSDSLTGNSSWTRKIEYNSSGLVTNAYDARGVQTTFSYDDLNRITQISYSDSTPTAHYYYDSQSLPSGAPSSSDSYSPGYSTGRLAAMTYGSGATGTYFGYDTAGRVVQQFQLTGSTPVKYKLSYSYNYAGLLTGETYPLGRAMAYSYDDGGRLSQVTDTTNSITFANSFAYSAHGGLTSEAWGNSAAHTMAYNRRLQASQVKLSITNGTTTILQQYDYSYGQFNTSTGAVDTSKNNGQIGKIDGTIGTTAQWNQGFSYDELGRLSNVVENPGSTISTTPNYSQGYSYDRYGNRMQNGNTPLGLPQVSSSDYDTTNNNNRFVSSVASYDNAGNITTDYKFRGMNYTYDANGRMKTAQRTDGTDGQNSVYDCAGQRVQTSANNVTRTMVYDIFGQLVADYLGSGSSTLERENIYRGGQLLAVYEAAGSCYKTITAFVDAFYSALSYTPATGERDNAIATLTQAQAQGQGQLIAAAQSFGASVFTSTQYLNHLPDTSANHFQFVTDLYKGFLQRNPNDPPDNNWDGHTYWLNILNSENDRNHLITAFKQSTEFNNNVAALCTSTSSTSASYHYVLTDVQGTTRAVMDNNGGNSLVIARHDFLPFGEELWAGIGSRSSSTQAYGATDAIRQKYGLTERDDATGLDHTWWRKYESFSGRWTSPDPYNGSMAIANPQGFNRYAYTQNDPVNFRDPSGLELCYESWCLGGSDSYGAHVGWGGGGSYFGSYGNPGPGFSSHITEALHAYDQRLQNSLDAIRANHALHTGDMSTYSKLMDSNKTLVRIAVLSEGQTKALAWIAFLFGQAVGDQARFAVVANLSGLSDYINSYTYNPADRTFDVSFKTGVDDFLANSPYFAGPGIALLHGNVGVWDYRSYTDLTGGLSMQVVLGNDLRKSYADFDRYNPYQDVYSFIRHNVPIVLRRIFR